MPLEPRKSFIRRSLWSLPATGLLALACLAGPASAQETLGEIGVWFDDTGDGAVEIFRCNDRLCGRIVWLRDPLNAQGKPKSDFYNPDPSQRQRPICGLPILSNLRRMTDGSWDYGTVYDPKKGSQHEAAIKLLRPDKLQLTGFGLGRLLSKSFIWTRAPADLQLCTQPSGSASGGKTPPAAQKSSATPAKGSEKPAAAKPQQGAAAGAAGSSAKAPAKPTAAAAGTKQASGAASTKSAIPATSAKSSEKASGSGQVSSSKTYTGP